MSKVQINRKPVDGHILENTNAQYWPLLQNNPNIFNVGVDIHCFAPVPFEEMLENNAAHKYKNVPKKCR